MSTVDVSQLGREFQGTPPYVVSAAKISEFAAATGATSPVHTSVEAAQQAGYSGVVAPPTFAVIIAQRAEAEYIEGPSGIDFSRVVHANESFTYSRPLVAGDVIHTVVKVTGITERAGITMVTTVTTLSTSTGEVVGTVESTLAVRGEGR